MARMLNGVGIDDIVVKIVPERHTAFSGFFAKLLETGAAAPSMQNYCVHGVGAKQSVNPSLLFQVHIVHATTCSLERLPRADDPIPDTLLLPGPRSLWQPKHK